MKPEQFIEQGTAILADILHSHTKGADKPIYRSDEALYQQLNNPCDLPEKGLPLSVVVEEAIAGLTMGYSNVQHPGFMAYISPKPDLSSVLGDLLAAGHNQTSGAWRAGPFATVIERQVLSWICQLTGFPAQSGSIPNGIITNGGALANATALKLARENKLGDNVKNTGLYNSPVLRFYGSTETHFSVHRSLDFLGMGKNNLVCVPCNIEGQIDIELLEENIKQDIANGYVPCAVIALAGSTATGQIDSLDSIFQVCETYDLWFHIDGASGGVFAQHPATSARFTGLEKADSLCIDPCKWLFQSFGIGCLLVKDGHQLAESFAISSHYWDDKDEPDFFQMGLTGTRQWRSLGLWFSFKTLGLEGIHQQLGHIRHCARQLEYHLSLSSFIEVHPFCELAVTVFRIKRPSKHESNQINKALQHWLIEQDSFFLSELDINGDTWLRAAISNTTTSLTDINQLVQKVTQFHQAMIKDSFKDLCI
jgi:L-2,4-diaminobutyrate decarboxylase